MKQKLNLLVVRNLSEHIIHHLHSIRLDLLSINERAHKCYLKCGFKDTGVSREQIFLNGEYYDKLHMDILENEFEGDYIRNKNISI